MILSTILLFIALIINLTIFRKKMFLYPLCLKTLGIVLIVFSAIEYVVKLSTYAGLLDCEYSIYLFLSNIKLHLNAIAAIGNVGLTLFSIGNIAYIVFFYKWKKIWTVLLCIPIIIITYLGSYEFGNFIYLYCHTKKTFNCQSVNLAIILLQTTMLLIYMTLPYIISIISILKTKLFKNRRSIIFKLIAWSTLDLLIILLVFVSDLKYYSFHNLSLLKYPLNTGFSVQNNFFIILSITILSIFLIIGIIKYTPFKNLTPNFDKVSLDYTNENFIMLLHTYKNAFCTIMQFSDDNNNFIQDNNYRFNVIKDIANDQFEEISKIINISRGTIAQDSLIDFVNIIECIDNAIIKTVSQPNITINKNYISNNYKTLGNKAHLTEAFVCIIKNSLEAIQNNTSTPILTITVGAEKDKIYINITDNGIGIKKHTMSKIFTPLFSSKSGGKNFGIGLTYAKRIIESHGGSISIKSRYNKYTTVQMTLPNLVTK